MVALSLSVSPTLKKRRRPIAMRCVSPRRPSTHRRRPATPPLIVLSDPEPESDPGVAPLAASPSPPKPAPWPKRTIPRMPVVDLSAPPVVSSKQKATVQPVPPKCSRRVQVRFLFSLLLILLMP